jgi:SAM-dependent methyltransferase
MLFNMMKPFNPSTRYLGNYAARDSTVEFYQRINTLINLNSTVLNLGAGRGAWSEIETSELKRNLQDICPKVTHYIGADIDPVVLENTTTSENVLITDGIIPIEDKSVDLIIADWVLEHVSNPAVFCKEVDRVLKTNGYFCARTPHVLSYWALAGRLVGNARHNMFLKYIQPGRQEVDIFPTCYMINTLSDIKSHFSGYRHYSYLYVVNPAYFFGKKFLYGFFEFMHNRLLPRPMSSCILVFMQKLYPYD